MKNVLLLLVIFLLGAAPVGANAATRTRKLPEKKVVPQKKATTATQGTEGVINVPPQALPPVKRKSALGKIAPIDENFEEPAAYSVFDVPEMKPVMSKKYSLQNEAAANFTYFPVGAFNKYLSLGGSYTRYFNAVTGWEVVNANLAFELESSLKKELQKSPYNGQEDEFPVLQWMATSNYIYSPFYTKSVLLNKRQVYSQMSFAGGGGLASFKIKTVPLLDAGVILRFYNEAKGSLKFDFRYIYFLENDAALRNQIAMTVGWSYHFGGKD